MGQRVDLSEEWGQFLRREDLISAINKTQFGMTLWGLFPVGEDFIPSLRDGLRNQFNHFSCASSISPDLRKTVIDKVAYFARDKDALSVLTGESFDEFFSACRSTLAAMYAAACSDPDIQQYILRKLVNMAGQPVILSLAASHNIAESYLSTALEQINELVSRGTTVDHLKMAKDFHALFLDVRDQSVLGDEQERTFFQKINSSLDTFALRDEKMSKEIEKEQQILCQDYALPPGPRLKSTDYQSKMDGLCQAFKKCTDENSRPQLMEEIADLTRSGPILRSFVDAGDQGREALFDFCQKALITLVPEEKPFDVSSPSVELSWVKQSSRAAFTRNVYEAIGVQRQAPLNEKILDGQERLFSFVQRPESRGQIVQNLFDMSQDNDVVKTDGYERVLGRIKDMLSRFAQDSRLSESEKKDYSPMANTVSCYAGQYRKAIACVRAVNDATGYQRPFAEI